MCEVQPIPSLCHLPVKSGSSSNKCIISTDHLWPTCTSWVSRHLIPNSALEAHEDRHSVRNTGGVVNEEDCTWTGKENLTSYLLEEYFKTIMANQKDELRWAKKLYYQSTCWKIFKNNDISNTKFFSMTLIDWFGKSNSHRWTPSITRF